MFEPPTSLCLLREGQLENFFSYGQHRPEDHWLHKENRLLWQRKALPWCYCEPGLEPSSVPSISNDDSDFSMHAYFTNLLLICC